MTTLVIDFTDDGSITNWRYVPEDDYEPGPNQLTSTVDHRQIPSLTVDTSSDPPELVDDPDYDPRSPGQQALDGLDDLRGRDPINRGDISDDTRAELEEAIVAVGAVDDPTQEALGIIYDILTGEGPPGEGGGGN